MAMPRRGGEVELLVILNDPAALLEKRVNISGGLVPPGSAWRGKKSGKRKR